MAQVVKKTNKKKPMDWNHPRQTSDRLAGFRGAGSPPSAKTLACLRAEEALWSGPQLQTTQVFNTVVGSPLDGKMFIVCIFTFILKSLKTPTGDQDSGALVASVLRLHQPQSKISLIHGFRGAGMRCSILEA